MLSFLRDQGFEDTLENTSAGQNDASNTPQSSEENNNKANDQEYLTVATKKSNVRKSTILLAVLFIVGLTCLWFMIKKSTPQSATAETDSIEDAQIEMAITKLTGVRAEMFKGIEKIVKKFYEFSDVRQIKVNELVKNPFEHEIVLTGFGKMPDTRKKRFDRILQQQLNQQLKNMQLLSIMQSDAGICCMINDTILYEGDSIRGFYVRQIGDNFVKLEKMPEGRQKNAVTDESLQDNSKLDSEPLGAQIVLKLSE